MLTNEIMGVVCLWILWVNTLLVAAQTWKYRAQIARRLASWRGRLAEGTVLDGGLAELVMHRMGRALDGDKRTIGFSDRSLESVINGGRIQTADGVVELPASTKAEVWLTPDELAAATECPGPAEFDEVYAEAKRPRGYQHDVRVPIDTDARVWFVEGDAEHTALVSRIDPVAWARTQQLKLLGFIVAILVGAAACTFVALYPPIFGTVSTIGGALGLAFFLLVQPAGTWIRDLVLEPHRGIYRMQWVESAPSQTRAPAPA